MGKILLNTQLYARMKRDGNLSALATFICLSREYPGKVFRQADSYYFGLSKTKICTDLHVLVRYKLASVNKGMVVLASQKTIKKVYGGDAKLFCNETKHGAILKFLKFLPALKVLKNQKYVIERRAHLCNVIEPILQESARNGYRLEKKQDIELTNYLEELESLKKNGTFRDDNISLTIKKISETCGCSVVNGARYREYMQDLGYIKIGKQKIVPVYVSDDYQQYIHPKVRARRRKRGVDVKTKEFNCHAIEFYPSPIQVLF